MKMMKNVTKFLSKKKNQAILVVCVLVLIIIVVVLIEVNKNNNNKNNNNQNNNNGNNVNNSNNVNNNNKNNNQNNNNKNNNKNNGVNVNKICDAMENFKQRYVKDDSYDGEFDDYSREKCLKNIENTIVNDASLNGSTKEVYTKVMIDCLLESSNNEELLQCLQSKMNQIKVNEMATNDTANDEPEDLINDGNNGNNNSITFGGVNNSGNNKQLNKNRIRIGPQRGNLVNNGNNNGNNNSIHFETVNHTSHNNENIDQLSKNMYRMEAQRESNNKAINKFLRNHKDN